MKLPTDYSLTKHVYIKHDLVLNNSQELICHKTPTSQPHKALAIGYNDDHLTKKFSWFFSDSVLSGGKKSGYYVILVYICMFVSIYLLM